MKRLILDTVTGAWRHETVGTEEIATMAPSLDQVKSDKMTELNQACNRTILGRFTSTITDVSGTAVNYEFSNDLEAQSNFKDASWALENGKATSVKWTAYDNNGNVVRVDLDLAQLSGVNADRLLHQQTAVSNLRDTLQAQVEAATTVEEVQAIAW